MMGRREPSNDARRTLWRHQDGEKTIYVNCRIENQGGAYRHYDRVEVTEIDGEVVSARQLPDLNTLVRV
jgi:hypothetical protein